MPPGGVARSTVVIPRRSSFASLDALTGDIAARQAAGERVSLRVPHDLVSDDFGLVEGVIQTICTWAEGDEDRTLHSYFDPHWSDEQFRTILGDGPHLLAAITAARTVLSTGGVDITRRMTSLAREVAAREADTPERYATSSAAYFMYENAREQWAGVAHRLYDRVPVRTWMWTADEPRRAWPFAQANRPRVQRGLAFTDWLVDLSQRLVRGREVILPVEPYAHLSSALSELLDNADVWGRAARTRDPSFWMLRAEWMVNTREGLARLGEGDRAIREFSRRHAAKGNMLHAVYSVVDAGPGVFSRRIDPERAHNPETQFDVVRTVLGEGVTDDRGGRGENRGMGFTNVFEALTALGGVLRLRTGALSLSRDFAVCPLDDSERARPRVFDSVSGDATPTPHPRVAGTAVTVVIPTMRETS